MSVFQNAILKFGMGGRHGLVLWRQQAVDDAGCRPRGRMTEIDYVNGYVARLGRESGVFVNINSAITHQSRLPSRSEPSSKRFSRHF